MLLASIVDGNDLGMLQATCRLSFTEEPFAGIGEFVTVEFLRQRHGLDRYNATNFGVFAQIDHTHRALAKLFLDLIATQHRLLDAAIAQHQGASRMPAAAAQNNRF